MNRLLLTACCCALTFLSALVAAEKPSAAVPAGKYVGTWKGPSDTHGDLRITLKHESDARWSAEAIFTFEGGEVPTTTKSVRIDGAKLVLVFAWSIEGTPGESTLTGEFADGKLGGTYRTATETPSSGTWSVRLAN